MLESNEKLAPLVLPPADGLVFTAAQAEPPYPDRAKHIESALGFAWANFAEELWRLGEKRRQEAEEAEEAEAPSSSEPVSQ